MNGGDTIPPIFASREDSLRHTPGDSLYNAARQARRDSAAAARKAARDSAKTVEVRVGAAATAAATGATMTMRPSRRTTARAPTPRSRGSMRYDGTLPVQIIVPCDTLALLHSPELPPTIYSAGEETFGVAERDAAREGAHDRAPARLGPAAGAVALRPRELARSATTASRRSTPACR